MKKVIVVVGPTGIGKTKLSIELAKKLNTEIISGDSVAVYKELNIGSAKPNKEEQSLAKHHLIDILEPSSQYNVADFQKEARTLIDNSDKPLIICGGTGLYIQSVIYDYRFDASKRDSSFEQKYRDFSNEELYLLLEKTDKEACKKIHMNNRKRVLRALEVALNEGSFSDNNTGLDLVYDPYIIYLDLEREKLYERINLRVDKMIAEGLVKEVKDLYDKNIFPHAIGYQELVPYFKGFISLETAIDEIKKNTRHLAKRQKTWFKNKMNAHFYQVNLDDFDKTIAEVYKDVREFID